MSSASAAAAAAAVIVVVEALERRCLLSVAPTGPEFQVNADPWGSQHAPAVASTGNGNFVVAWHNDLKSGNTDRGVYAQRYDGTGQKQGAKFRVNTYTQDAQREASIAADAAGNFVVTWQSYGQDGSADGVFAQRYDAAGDPLGPEIAVNTTTYLTQDAPQVAMGAEGDFVIVWQSSSPSGVFFQRFSAAGAKVGAETRVDVQAASSGARFPSVAVAADGRFAVAWQALTYSPTSAAIRAQLFTASGAKVGAEIAVNTSTVAIADAPAVAFDTAGRLAVAWSGTRAGAQHVMLRHFGDTGDALGQELQADEQSGAGSASVRPLSDGGLVVSWTTAGLDSVAYRVFDASGNAASPERRVNTFLPGMQYAATIAGDDRGGFVVAWESENQDGDGTGIFAQRYAAVTDAASVAGVVWDDTNEDGVRQTGEPFVSGVGVELFTTSGAPAGQTPSGPSGEYRFDGLQPGDGYYVRWALPAGRAWTLANRGSNDTTDSDADPGAGRSPLFTPSANQAITSVDAGLVLPASVGGMAWVDANANGVRDAGEMPRGGLAVTLLNGSAGAVASATTAGDGTYRFDGLQPNAAYALQFAPPTGLALSPADRGADDAADSDPDPVTRRTTAFVLAPAAFDDTWDAGLVPEATVAGAVFRDANGNGLREAAEAALPGWTVFVDANSNDQLDADERSFATNSNGAYTITGLSAGTYRIGTVVPPGWSRTTPPARRTITVATAQALADVQLGHVPISTPIEATPAGAEFGVNETTAKFQGSPGVAGDGSGRYVAVWSGVRPEDGMYGVYARLYNADGTPRGGEFLVAGDAGRSQDWATVGMAAGGDFVVAWYGSDGVHARRFAADGVPLGAAFRVDQTGGFHGPPTLMVRTDGAFAVAWTGATPHDTSGVVARAYDAQGRPLFDELAVNEVTPGGQGALAVGLDAADRLTVAWLSLTPAGVREGVFARQFDRTGTAITRQFLVSTAPTTGDISGTLLVDPGGDVLFAWKGVGGVSGRLFAPGGVARAPAFNVTPDGSAELGDATRLSDGSFVLTWSSQDSDGSGRNVYAQLLDPFGIPHGRRIRLNTFTSGDQERPTVAAGPGRTFVAAWQSYGQDGSAEGVYAQRFEVFTDADRAPVGDFVWLDADGDGVQDEGEVGQDRVTVEVYTADGSFVDRTVTAGGGRYSFGALREGRTYRLRFVAPSNRMFTAANQGGDDATDSDVDPQGWTAPFQAQVGGDTRLDAGMFPGALITGTAYHDADADGVRTGSDPVLAEWTVFLDSNGNGSLDPSEPSTLTTAFGTYLFRDLRPGPYRVRLVPATYWAASAGPDRTLAPGQSLTGVDVAARPVPPTTSRSTPVGPETHVNSTTAGNQFAPAVAADASGNYAVVWVGPGGVYGQRYDASGAPRGGEFRVNQTAAGNYASVAVDAGGGIVVAWSDGSEVYARRFDAAGSPLGDEFRVNTTTAGAQSRPEVATGGQGGFVIVWQSGAQDGSGSGVYGRSYAADGSPRGDEFRANQFKTSDQGKPAVAMSAAGGFVVAWETQHPNGTQQWIFARRFDSAGAPVDVEFPVDANPSSTQLYEPAIGMNAAGEFVVAWTGSDANNFGVEARRFDALGTPQGESFVVNSPSDGLQYAASVAVGADGGFVIAWNDSGDVGTGVRAQRFNAAGIRLGGPFAVNATSAGAQSDPAVALLPDGFVVTWTGDQQDGSGYGVYAQRFAAFEDGASVGDTVFVDANDDGVRDAGEVGRDGVVVTLVNEWGVPVATTVSAGGGNFRFDGLRPGGTYTLAFTAPGNFAFARRDQGGDDAADSDVDPANGRTAPFTVVAGGIDLTLDAGLVALASAHVAGVYVSGSGWDQAFNDSLAARGEGDATYGFRFDPASGATPAFGWGNLDRISVRFTDAFQALQAKLILRAADGASYTLGGAAYDAASRTATWSTQGMPGNVLPPGNWTVTLEADPSSGENLPGRFEWQMSSLPGDTNGDRAVNFIDLLALARNYNGTGKTPAQGDLDGDGVVGFVDLLTLARNYNKSLPAPSAGAALVSVGSSAMPPLAEVLAQASPTPPPAPNFSPTPAPPNPAPEPSPAPPKPMTKATAKATSKPAAASNQARAVIAKPAAPTPTVFSAKKIAPANKVSELLA